MKLYRGNPGKENLGKKLATELQPPPSDLSPPEVLAGVALEVWNTRASQLAALGLLTVADRQTLERYCLTYELFYQAYKSVKADGLSSSTAAGTKKGNPDVVAMRGYHADLLRIEQEFGLTPSSRCGMQINNGQEINPLAAFLQG
jgi:P27 family predicted phage terminase small subunit